MQNESTRTLRPYQNRACWALYKRKRAALYAGLGSGKTAIMLHVLKRLLDEGKIRSVLLLAPIGVAKTVWQTEAAEWPVLQGLRFSLALGTPKQRMKALETDADIYIINYENVNWLFTQTDFMADALVLDESSMVKSHSSKRFKGGGGKKGLKQVCRDFEYVYEITGTPKSGEYLELWSQIYILDQGKRLGDTITRFKGRYYTQYGPEPYMIRLRSYSAGVDIQNKLKDICYRVPDSEVRAVLPDIVKLNHMIDLPSKVRNLYNEAERDFFLKFDSGEEMSVENAAILAGKLQQIASGAVYDDDRNVLPLHDEKIRVLEALIEDIGDHNALVIYNFKHDLTRLLAWHDAPVLRSSMPTAKFVQLRDEWNNRQHKIVYGHPRSMSHGLNLQGGGHHLIFFGLPWSLDQYQQVIGRLARSGQEALQVFVHHIVANDTVESGVILPRLAEREQDQNAFLAALAAYVAQRKKLC